TRQRYYPERAPGELFPLLTIKQVRASGPAQPRTLAIEIGREAATIIMLAGIALAVARSASQWSAAFVIAFGVWDITFYIFLKVLLDWPASLLTWDVLFLIPLPWVGPVLAPVLVSAAMIGAGIWQLRKDADGEPITIGSAHWAGIIIGAAIIVAAFMLDWRNIMAGGMPHPFNWTVFGAGMTVGAGSYLSAIRQSRWTNPRAIEPVCAAEPGD
ncbi:MAG TPA: hypothetical protein VH518_04095, partial [Tepidisphaeraceae bacterium]